MRFMLSQSFCTQEICYSLCQCLCDDQLHVPQLTQRTSRAASTGTDAVAEPAEVQQQPAFQAAFRRLKQNPAAQSRLSQASAPVASTPDRLASGRTSTAANAGDLRAGSEACPQTAGSDAPVLIPATAAIAADATAAGTAAHALAAPGTVSTGPEASNGGFGGTVSEAAKAAVLSQSSAAAASQSDGVAYSAGDEAGNAPGSSATSAMSSSAAASASDQVTGSQPSLRRVTQGGLRISDRGAADGGNNGAEQPTGIQAAPDLAPKSGAEPIEALEPKEASQPAPDQVIRPDQTQAVAQSGAVEIPRASSHRLPILAGSLSNADEMAGADDVVMGSLPSRHPRQRLDFGEHPANVRLPAEHSVMGELYHRCPTNLRMPE